MQKELPMFNYNGINIMHYSKVIAERVARHMSIGGINPFLKNEKEIPEPVIITDAGDEIESILSN